MINNQILTLTLFDVLLCNNFIFKHVEDSKYKYYVMTVLKYKWAVQKVRSILVQRNEEGNLAPYLQQSTQQVNRYPSVLQRRLYRLFFVGSNLLNYG